MTRRAFFEAVQDKASELTLKCLVSLASLLQVAHAAMWPNIPSHYGRLRIHSCGHVHAHVLQNLHRQSRSGIGLLPVQAMLPLENDACHWCCFEFPQLVR